jgi:hypothetical protein
VNVDKIDPAFGHWLAGFIDGEGCFILSPTGHGYFYARFHIKVRDDDADIILQAYEAPGLGNVYYRPHKNSTSNPAIVWQIQKQSECRQFVKFLERFPLRAKKKRDFEIWKEALGELQQNSRDRPKLRYLNEKLKFIRRYRPDDDEPVYTGPTYEQLSFAEAMGD